ncbi:MAG: hypothetical protein HYU86_00645 [Chloroflexi bacterium]|nr:hypothetical protein [Chloroflexota bacterium]
MNRLEQLQRKFPHIPRSIILKTDVTRLGIRHSPALSQAGAWASPQTLIIFDRDHEEPAPRKSLTTEGWVSLPQEMHLQDSSLVGLSLDSRSPYQVVEGEGRYLLCLGEESVDEVSFDLMPRWYHQRTRSGALMSTVGAVCGDLFATLTTNHCQYFNTGEQCRFCCINPTTTRSQELGIGRTITRAMEDVVETFTAACAEGNIGHYVITGGSFVDRRKEGATYQRFASALANVASRFGNIPGVVFSQALEEEDMRRIHEMGAGNLEVCFPLEVWDERVFERVCPGKARYVGRKTWLDSLLKAVDIFGAGKVICQFIVGSEVMPGYGFASWEGGMKSTLEGMEWMMERGIIPIANMVRAAKGTLFEEIEPPPTEYFLALDWERHQLMVKYNMPAPRSRCRGCRPNACEYDYVHLLTSPAL